MQDNKPQAGFAHEVVMMNLAIFHLLLPVAALSSGYIKELLTLALIGSAMMMFWVYRQSYQAGDSELVNTHWKLAWRRCRILLIAYAVSASIMGLGWLLTLLQTDQNMKLIFLVIFTRIAVVPTILTVMVLFVVESTALSQARQGEIAN